MKELISAMNISEARKAGLQSISVPPGALITPQARDDARSYGIALVTQEKPIPASIRASAAAVDPQRQFMVLAQEPIAAQAVPPISVQPSARPFGQSVEGLGGAAPAATLAAAVLDRLNALLASRGGVAAFPGLEATIASIIAEFSSQAGAPGVDAVRLPEKKSPRGLQGEVEVEEALTPGQEGPGVTRFSWSNSSFAWIFEYDEVLVVTEGRVEAGGLEFFAGEALRVRAGTNLTLTARGDASCVCSSWPDSNHG